MPVATGIDSLSRVTETDSRLTAPHPDQRVPCIRTEGVGIQNFLDFLLPADCIQQNPLENSLRPSPPPTKFPRKFQRTEPAHPAVSPCHPAVSPCHPATGSCQSPVSPCQSAVSLKPFVHRHSVSLSLFSRKILESKNFLKLLTIQIYCVSLQHECRQSLYPF